MHRTSVLTVVLASMLVAPSGIRSGGGFTIAGDEPPARARGEDGLYREMSAKSHVWHLEFSPDSKKLAGVVGLVGEGDVVIWDLETMASWTLPRDKHDGDYADVFSFLEFVPDGSALVTLRNFNSGEYAIDLWSGKAFDVRRRVGEGNGEPVALAISPNSKFVAASAWEGQEGQGMAKVPVWNLPDGKPGAVLPTDGHQVIDLSYSDDSKSLAAVISQSRGEYGVQVWNVDTRQTIAQRRFPNCLLFGVRFDTVGQAFVLMSHRGDDFAIYDAITGVERVVPKLSRIPCPNYCLNGPCARLAAGFRNGKVEVYDMNTAHRIHAFPRPLNGFVSGLAFSKDGKWLAASTAGSDTAGFQSRVAVWDLSENENQ